MSAILSDLIAELREGRFVSWIDALNWCHRAADHIASLEATIAELRAGSIKFAIENATLGARAVAAEASNEALRAALEETREANGKLHRRVQIAEAFMQSAEEVPGGWLKILRDGQHGNTNIIIRDLIKTITKAKARAARTLSQSGEG